MSFEEDYFDVLKSIELAVVTTFAQLPNAKDRHVDDALNGLVRYYNAAIKGKKTPTLKLDAESKQFYEAIMTNMAAHMSVGLMGSERTYTVEEVVLCLKRIERSVGQMLKVGGLGGTKYLEFVRDYHNPNKPKTLG